MKMFCNMEAKDFYPTALYDIGNISELGRSLKLLTPISLRIHGPRIRLRPGSSLQSSFRIWPPS